MQNLIDPRKEISETASIPNHEVNETMPIQNHKAPTPHRRTQASIRPTGNELTAILRADPQWDLPRMKSILQEHQNRLRAELGLRCFELSPVQTTETRGCRATHIRFGFDTMPAIPMLFAF